MQIIHILDNSTGGTRMIRLLLSHFRFMQHTSKHFVTGAQGSRLVQLHWMLLLSS